MSVHANQLLLTSITFSKRLYIDGKNNIYKTEDILQNSQNPKIFAKYIKEDGIYKFIETYNS